MDSSQRSNFRVALIVVIFFVISLLTNIIGALIPDIIRSFQLSLTMAAFLPFAFFAAYVVSIPCGMIVEKWGEKRILLGAFVFAMGGSLLFSLKPLYPTAIVSFFIIGLGMAALQVAINPLLRVAGGEEHYAFNAVLAQLFFGAASFVSPLIYSYFTVRLSDSSTARLDALTRALSHVVPHDMPWVSIYWIFSFITLLMVTMIAFVRFQKVERKDDEKTGAVAVHLELLKKPLVWLYFIGIFAYVGIEQGLNDWMSQFLASYHGFNPQVEGASAVSRFWLLMTVGAGVGLVLLKIFDSRQVLLASCVATIVSLTTALFGPASLSIASFPWIGFTISCMWSIVFSLALNSISEHHGTFSGILCTGIVGGALAPLFIGFLGDHFGLRAGICFLYLPLAYILSMSLWAKPLIANKTIGASVSFDEVVLKPATE